MLFKLFKVRLWISEPFYFVNFYKLLFKKKQLSKFSNVRIVTMQINYYNNTSPYNIRQQNFQARTKLGRQVDEYLKLPKTEEKANTLIENIKTFINHPRKPLGEGFRGLVYRIDDKYAIKCLKHLRGSLENITPCDEPDLSCLKSYYGSPVVRFNNGMNILRNVSSNGKHFCAGIPAHKSNSMLHGEKEEYWSNIYLPIFAELPQKSFDAIAKDFSALNKLGELGYNYSFDTKNPNNIVLVGKNTLRIVDDLDHAYTRNENTTGGLLRLFVEKMDLDYLAPKDITNQDLRKALIKKVILAGEKYELPILKEQLDLRTWRNITEEFCEYREITDGLKRLRREYPDKKTRLREVEKLLDYLLSQQNYTLWTSL